MENRLFIVGLFVFLTGLGIIFAGTLGQGSASVGGVVFIGPFPIVFGSGPGGLGLAIGSLVIGAVMVLLLLVWGMRLGRKEGAWRRGF